MPRVTISKCGDTVLIPIPDDVTTAIGLTEGEEVEIEARGSDLVIRRRIAQDRTDAQKAAEEFLQRRTGYTLGGLSIRDLIDEGRR